MRPASFLAARDRGFDINDLFRIIDPAPYQSLSWKGLPALLLKVIGTPLFLWVYLATSIKRLHDRDKSGWWMVPFFLVPGLYNQFADRFGDYWVAALPFALIALTALAMGTRNAAVRKLAIPDLTTTVLTLTITGIGADSSLANGNSPRLARRVASVTSMFLGAALGAVVIRYSISATLWLATAISAVCSAALCARPISRECKTRLYVFYQRHTARR